MTGLVLNRTNDGSGAATGPKDGSGAATGPKDGSNAGNCSMKGLMPETAP